MKQLFTAPGLLNGFRYSFSSSPSYSPFPIILDLTYLNLVYIILSSQDPTPKELALN